MVIEELKHSIWKVIWDAELGEECINEICVDIFSDNVCDRPSVMQLG